MTHAKTDVEGETLAAGSEAPGRQTVDFDLHGLARIRLIEATTSDIRTVARQVGPIQAPVTGDADIIIRFVDEVPLHGPLRIVGLDQGGYTDDAFIVLRSKHKSQGRVCIPLDEIGGRFEILCERGAAAVPQLIPILNLTVLARGALPLHASAFVIDGIGVAACGWSKGGKTETLLSFMRHGAQYVGDEWVYVTGDGRWLHGIPEPIRLWDWHLGQIPEYRKLVSRKDRAKLSTIGALEAARRGLPDRARRRLPGMHAVDRVLTLLEGQRHVDPPAEQLFGRERWVDRAPFDRLLFLGNARIPAVRVEAIDPLQVAERMTFSHVHHRLGFLDYYWQYRYAFPDRPNRIVDEIESIERRLLRQVFADKTALEVLHPHPVDISGLFDAIRPHLG